MNLQTRTNPFNSIYKNLDFTTARITKKAEKPFFVDVELTNQCNLMCKMCARKQMTREKGFMPLSVFSKILDECIELGIPIRFIRWGEPFLHPNIIDWARKIKEAGLFLHITNNGLVIKKEQMQELVDMKLDSIIFSMQGATKEKYEDMRNNNRYDDLVENIRLFVGLRGEKDKPFIHISSTMTNETEKEIEEFRQFWSEIVDSVGIGKTSFVAIGSEMIENIPPCNEVWTKLSIDWDGKVTACCGDYNNLLTIGDINKSSLKEIWQGNKLKAVREMLSNNLHKSLSLCSKCEYAYQGF